MFGLTICRCPVGALTNHITHFREV